jgi:hypothetical protein
LWVDADARLASGGDTLHKEMHATMLEYALDSTVVVIEYLPTKPKSLSPANDGIA